MPEFKSTIDVQSNYTLPTTGGSVDDVLTYDGTNAVWQAPSGGGGASHPTLKAWQALGSDIQACNNYDGLYTQLNDAAIGSRIARYVGIYLPEAATLTGAAWIQMTNGNYTANNYNGVGLYSYSGGTLTLVASSTNDGNCWQQGTGFQKKAFSSSYAAAAGFYYVVFLYSSSAETTAPEIGRMDISGGSDDVNSLDFSNSALLNGFRVFQTSLDTSFLVSSMSRASYNSIYYAFLY